MNHSLSPFATRLNIKQDFADADDELPIKWEDVDIAVFKVNDPSPRAHALGLPAAVSLLDQIRRPSYDMLKVAQQGLDCKECIEQVHKIQHAKYNPYAGCRSKNLHSQACTSIYCLSKHT